VIVPGLFNISLFIDLVMMYVLWT